MSSSRSTPRPCVARELHRSTCRSPAVVDFVLSRELHVFRGHETTTNGFIMGHEFTGEVVETGSTVTSVRVGDRVVSPFTVSWYEIVPRHPSGLR